MTSIVIEGEIDEQHVREDGSKWPFAMAKGAKIVFADCAKDLLSHVIHSDYGDYDETIAGNTKALIARWQSAVATAGDIQSLLCADKAVEGKFDPAAETEDVLTALFGDKSIPVEEFDTWTHPDVPLVVIATDYAPFTDRTPPTGNLIWLDPSDEVAYLHSLANAGVIDLYTADED